MSETIETEIETQFDPFAPDLPDETTELGALTAALRLANHFTLLFARCDQPQHRRRIIADIQERLYQRSIQEIVFSEPITHLLDELRVNIEKPTPDAVFVVGLENSVSVLQQSGNVPVIANLNAARNSFSRYVPCPLVLWLPEYVLTAIFNGAPDFFSVCSGVYQFDNSSAANLDFSDDFSDLDVRGDTLDTGGAMALSNEDKQTLASSYLQERLANLCQLLCETQSLPANQRDLRMEARLLNQIGSAYFYMFRYDEAEQAQQQSLALHQQLNDRRGEAATLNYLGRIYRHQNLPHKSEEAHRQSLAIFQDVQDYRGEASSWNYLGRTLRYLKKPNDSEAAHRNSVALYERYGDSGDVARTRNSLGRTLRHLKRFDEAEVQHKEALAIYRRRLERDGEAKTLNYLGILHRLQHRYQEAEHEYLESLRIKQTLNDLSGQATVLENLATLRAVQGDIAGALDFAKQLLAVRRQQGSMQVIHRIERQIEQWQQEQRGE